jgi:hypothetical protein
MEEEKKISLNDKIVNLVSNNIVWVFLGFIVIVIILPRLFIGTSKIGFLDNLKPNEIGDAIGGMTAPIIGLFSAFLVYIAFREQKKANEIQLDLIKEQKKSSKEEREYRYILDKISSIEKNILNFEFTEINNKDKENGTKGLKRLFEYSFRKSIMTNYSLNLNISMYNEMLYNFKMIDKLMIRIKESSLDIEIKYTFLNEIKLLFNNLIEPNINYELMKNEKITKFNFIIEISDCLNKIKTELE